MTKFQLINRAWKHFVQAREVLGDLMFLRLRKSPDETKNQPKTQLYILSTIVYHQI